MKMLRIWILAAVILAYSVYTAVGISREFDGLQMRNETICRLNWEIRPGLMYTDIIPISGSGNYIVNEGGRRNQSEKAIGDIARTGKGGAGRIIKGR